MATTAHRVDHGATKNFAWLLLFAAAAAILAENILIHHATFSPSSVCIGSSARHCYHVTSSSKCGKPFKGIRAALHQKWQRQWEMAMAARRRSATEKGPTTACVLLLALAKIP